MGLHCFFDFTGITWQNFDERQKLQKLRHCGANRTVTTSSTKSCRKDTSLFPSPLMATAISLWGAPLVAAYLANRIRLCHLATDPTEESDPLA